MGVDVVSGAAGEGPRDVQVEELHVEECWRLLRDASVARLAFIVADGDPAIYPVNIHIDRGVILIQSADDAKLAALRSRPRVALEVDGGALRVRWSVVAHATAEVDVAAAEGGPPAADDAISWFPGAKTHLIRLTVSSITGRRFLVVAGARVAGRAGPPEQASSSMSGGESSGAARPTPIPSRPPLDDDLNRQ